MRIEFPSLATQGTVFTWHHDWDFLRDECRHGRPLSHHCGFFLTYGDGTTQHSHESAVQVHDGPDYLVSLATFLGVKMDARDFVAADWPRHPTVSVNDIEFALKVKYVEGKTQYFNRLDRRLSTADSKRHDKRWEIVGEWCKGDFNSALAILGQGYLSTLDRYAKAGELEGYMRDRGLWVTTRMKADAVGVGESQAEAFDVAFRAVDHYVRSVRERELAIRCLTAYEQNRSATGAPPTPVA
jgi:hypothetical protein